MSRRRRRRIRNEYSDVELNIMPFIDVFSMLNTFLLFSAVFLSIGIIEVQIPFMSNATPPEKPSRSLSVKVDVSATNVVLTSSYSAPPINEQKSEYGIDAAGLGELHKRLMELRQSNPDTDTVTVFGDDDVIYEKLTAVLDAIKFLREGEVLAVTSGTPGKGEKRVSGSFLFEKIVVGSVLL